MKRLLPLILASLLLAACSDVSETALEAGAAVKAGALLIDVRSPEEFAGGHLPGAINIPHGDIVSGMQALEGNMTGPIVLYCRSGNRSGIAQTSLAQAGYTNLMNAGAYSSLKPVWDADPEL